ncbi:odorant receptor Or1-like [Colletes latitarsis]|uniref:odorant receptor Or1-like n=1 Tax=Colletes latitarsis TaxID=2605962 RepID=UPI0040373C53
MVEFTVLCMILSSLFTDFRHRKLAYRAWLPFDYNDHHLYHVAYVHQLVSLIAVSLMNVACDVIVIGLYCHASSQQEILKYRLKRFTRETRSEFGKFVDFHNYLYTLVSQERFRSILLTFETGIATWKSQRQTSVCKKTFKETVQARLGYDVHFKNHYCTSIYFARHFSDFIYKPRYVSNVQKTFNMMIGIQLLSSTLVVCFIMYQLSNISPTSPTYLQFVMYMVCMTTQIFIYCWYGNQLKLKSVEILQTISELDWVYLDNSSKKDLIMVMRRTAKPIEMASAYVFTIDLNTFVKILKMSYSTYNLLQKTKES